MAAVSSDFAYRLLSKMISSGKPEFELVYLIFTFRKYCHIVFVSFNFVTVSEEKMITFSFLYQVLCLVTEYFIISPYFSLLKIISFSKVKVQFLD